MIQTPINNVAPALDVVAWINTTEPLTLSHLKGKVVVIHAFQMLCPGCVTHSIPQASAIFETYAKEDVQVIGLHTVFEHHNVMTFDALKAFVAEYRIRFPIAFDTPSESNAIPKTMAKYQMRGTPTLIVLDKNGKVQLNHFGRISDMQIGSLIGGLLAQGNELPLPEENNESSNDPVVQQCDDTGCSI
jgi:peroxiredoxin